jgi:hypothetical protein
LGGSWSPLRPELSRGCGKVALSRVGLGLVGTRLCVDGLLERATEQLHSHLIRRTTAKTTGWLPRARVHRRLRGDVLDELGRLAACRLQLPRARVHRLPRAEELDELGRLAACRLQPLHIQKARHGAQRGLPSSAVSLKLK